MKRLMYVLICLCVIATTPSTATAEPLTRREKIISTGMLVGGCAITIVSWLLSSKKQRTIVALNLQLNDAQLQALNLVNMARGVATHWENERDAIIYNRRRVTIAGLNRWRMAVVGHTVHTACNYV
jgi:hypothetical protein